MQLALWVGDVHRYDDQRERVRRDLEIYQNKVVIALTTKGVYIYGLMKMRKHNTILCICLGRYNL